MGKAKELQKQLLLALAEKLAPNGFRKSEQRLVRRIPGGKQIFHLNFATHGDVFKVIASVGVRHDSVEDLLQELDPVLSTQSKRTKTATIADELGALYLGRNLSWTIESEADVAEAGREILAAFNSIGMPYVERFSDLSEVLSTLSGDERAYDHVGAQRAIAAAFILGRKDLFDQLVEAKTRYMEQQNDRFGLAQFLPVAEELAEWWSSPDAGRLESKSG
jgi:hypothetical protein